MLRKGNKTNDGYEKNESVFAAGDLAPGAARDYCAKYTYSSQTIHFHFSIQFSKSINI
jgi:hypothetical protein